MKRTWYAVQHGDNFESDFGSTVKREAFKLARKAHKEYPLEEIRIVVCDTEDGIVTYCEDCYTVFEGWSGALIEDENHEWHREPYPTEDTL